jgi:Tfp pilus assembly protein PilX
MIIIRYQNQHQSQYKQQGSVLLISLVILLVMTIASIGLMRSVESGNVAAANISMGQNNQLIADWGVERGFEWLYTNRAILSENHEGNGYYAVKNGGNAALSDPKWLDLGNWAGAEVFDSSTSPATPVGYTVRILINRMCTNLGAVNSVGQSCAMGASSTSTSSCGSVKVAADGAAASTAAAYGVGQNACSGSGASGSNYIIPGNVYYRVTVRVEGPRNSLSVVQSMLTIAAT